MINQEESVNLHQVYDYLLKNEQDSWSKVDDYMTYLEFLDYDQLFREVEVMLVTHANGNPHCPNTHPKGTECIVDAIILAAKVLVREYVDGEPIYDEDYYVLKKYLALSQAGIILY